MRLKVFQVDAFASRVFSGNPAAVICLDEWPDDAVLVRIAAEQNAPTTAFLVPHGPEPTIRYFLPTGELPLVGHASLAAAHVLLRLLRPDLERAALRWTGGTLLVERSADTGVAITLPARPARLCPPPDGLAEALGIGPREVLVNDAQYFALLPDEAAVKAAVPDMAGLMRLDRDGVIVTARGTECDFVSRAFAPKEGLPEDPVCGSAHLALVPYWSLRLGRTRHQALQLSERGGELDCALEGNMVRLAGRCALYLEGTIAV